MKTPVSLFLIVLCLMGCKNEASNELVTDSKEPGLSVLEKIAAANGVAQFKELEEINYTFNVKRNDSVLSRRSWSWKPKMKEVTFMQADSSVTYNYQLDAEQYPEIDSKFINDQYWLFFPFHLVWDELEYDDRGKSTAPISKKELQQVRIKYPPDVGYTPGDTYDIFFDEDYLIREWVYHPSGDSTKAFAATWEAYTELSGMQISTMHKNAENTFQLFFTDLSVK